MILEPFKIVLIESSRGIFFFFSFFGSTDVFFSSLENLANKFKCEYLAFLNHLRGLAVHRFVNRFSLKQFFFFILKSSLKCFSSHNEPNLS